MRRKMIWIVVFLCCLFMAGMAYGAELGENWQEEYTDTETRKGVLAIRGTVFEGFSGEVFLTLETEEGIRLSYVLGESKAYILNLSLTPGIYYLCELSAEHEGREYRCDSTVTEFQVEEGQAAVCTVEVFPDSWIYFPEESEETLESPSLESIEESAETAQEEAKGGEEAPENRGFSLPAAIGAIGTLIFARRICKSLKGRE